MEKTRHNLLTAGQSAASARAVAIALLILLTGCLPGPTFRMVQNDLRRIDPKQVSYTDGANLTTRDWIHAVDDDLHELLPKNAEPVLTADKLVRADGTPRDIYRTFHIKPKDLDSLFGNFSGVSYTAKVVMRNDPPKNKEWPGYKRVTVPMDDGTLLYGRIGEPIGKDLGASYIVITHGMFGQQGGSDQYNLAQALRTFGHHVLLLDLRGHGETERHEPDDPYTFGIDEPVDLLATSRWLRKEQYAERVGLVSFSITAHHALLAAWLDGDPTLAGNPHSPILQALKRPDIRPQFDAGIIAISPVLNLCEYADSLNRRRGIFESPVRAVFQTQVERRLAEMGGGYRMWDYMKHELKRSRWSKEFPTFEMLFSEEMRFANLCATPQSGARRMDQIRVPILVLHAVNDPVGGSAQAVANIFGQTRNPNCGVIMTRDGGHTGMSALAPVYYYSLIRAFFDPATGPRAIGSQTADVAAEGPRQIRMEPITASGR